MHSKLFIDGHVTRKDKFATAILVVNKHTIAQLEGRISQARKPKQGQVEEIARSIEENGFDWGKPIIFKLDGKIADASTRTHSLILLVRQNPDREYLVPAVQADTQGDAHNLGRSLIDADVERHFKRTRRRGSFKGPIKKAVSEAKEAVRFLDAEAPELGKPSTPHNYLVTIENNSIKFSAAFDAAIELFKGKNPSNYKFAHWIAFFVRHDISNATQNIASKYLISSSHSHMPDRYKAFCDMEREYANRHTI